MRTFWRLLVALILYVNEIPDRRGDAHAGKRTLPVRFSRSAVIGGYNVAVVAAYAAVVAGVVAGLLPIPALLRFMPTIFQLLGTTKLTSTVRTSVQLMP